MKRLALALGILFAACGGPSSKPLRPSGTSGRDGSGAAGTGAAGMSAAGAGASAAGADAADASADTDAGQTNPAMSADGRCIPGAFSRAGGPCLCQPNIPLACGNGCVDKDTDNDNCGGCAITCGPTSTCVAGTCSPAPALVVPSAPGCTRMMVGSRDLGLSIAISGATLYVADAGHGTVTSRPVGGGATTTIASGEMAPHALAVAGTTVVWIASVAGPRGDGGLPVITASLRKAGAAAVTTLAMGTNEAGGIQGVTLSPAGDTAYYSADTSIMSIPTAGGVVTIVGHEEHYGQPGALALDGMKLAYPTGLNGDVDVITIEAGKVASCGLLDAASELRNFNCQLAGRGGALVLSTILARANRVYFADGPNIKANDTGPGAMRSNDSIAQSSGEDLRAMAMSADKIYFVHDDVVERTPLVPSSVAQPIARGQKTPASVAVGATKVYWGNDGDCTVASTDL